MTWMVAWLWQGTLVAAAALALLRLRRRVNATTRHLCLWLALIVVLALPAVEALRAFAGPDGPTVQAATAALQPGPFDREAAPALVAPVLPGWLPVAILTVWGLGIGLGVLRLVMALAALRRLKRSTTPAPELAAQLTVWRRCRLHGRSIALGLSDSCSGPCAVGLGTPTIVLPRGLIGRLSRTQLEALVLHEHAHLARYDDWTQLLQRVIEVVAGMHPGVWLLSRRIGLEREVACDDWVVRRTLPPHRYATCLADVASMRRVRAGRLADALTASAVGARSALRARVERLLSADVDHGRRLASPAVALTAAALACGSALAFATTPTVVFAESEDAVEHAAVSTSAAELKLGPAYDLASRPPIDRSRPPADVGTNVSSATAVRSAAAATSGRPNPSPAGEQVRPAGTAPRETMPPVALPEVAAAPHLDTDRPVPEPRFAGPNLTPVAQPQVRDQSPSTWGRVAAAGSGIGTKAGRSGVALGRGVQHAGSSIGGMFTRAARSIADGF